MDHVHLRSDLSCIVGILPRERIEPQRVIAEARLRIDLEPIGATGDLTGGVDYAAVDAWLRFLAVEGQFRLLESFALAALGGILRGPVQHAELSLSKPDVLRAAIPGISMARDAAWARGRNVLVDVPEVRVEEVAVAAGHTVTEPSFCLAEGRAMPRPWTADAARTLILVRRRA